jgi:hypothetical protein
MPARLRRNTQQGEIIRGMISSPKAATTEDLKTLMQRLQHPDVLRVLDSVGKVKA